VSDLRRLRQVEEENSRVNRLGADLSLDKHRLSEALRKKVYGPPAAENWPPGFRGRFRSVACGPAAWRSLGGRRGIDAAARRISPRCGSAFVIWPMRARGLGLCGSGGLLRRDGWLVNRKRGRRRYRREGLQLRLRVRRRKPSALHRGPAPTPAGPTERWSRDVVHDTVADGRPFRILTVVDHWSRHSPILEAGVRMSGEMVGQVLDRARKGTHGPRSLTVEHGTEFQSRALEDWADRRGVQLDFIRPGKPVENALLESFNGRLRDECLNVHQFTSMAEVQQIIEAWRLDYNQHRPHSSLGHLTPNEFLEQRQALQTGEEVGALVKICLGTGPTSNGSECTSKALDAWAHEHGERSMSFGPGTRRACGD
jgi:putative transposase